MAQYNSVETYQLPLNVQLQEQYCFSNFVVGQNQEVVNALKQTIQAQSGNMCLYGSAASGKTHLLQASCAWAHAHQCASFYLSFKEPSLRPSVLEGLEQRHLVCLDDIQLIAGQSEWEEALFHCYNRLMDVGGMLFLGSQQNPKTLPWILPDLQSRILAGLVLLLKPLKDEHMCQALQLRAEQRGMTIADDVCHYILTRLSREPQSLFDFFDLLDTTSLSAQRRVTIPFVKEVIKTSSQ